jgi:integral membrane protein
VEGRQGACQPLFSQRTSPFGDGVIKVDDFNAYPGRQITKPKRAAGRPGITSCERRFAGACLRRVKNPIPFLRQVARVEAISFLLLLFVAMPLKYFAGMPMAVRMVGLAHGLLFLVFCFALFRVMTRAKWPVGRGALIFVAALLPFGPFVVDRRMREYEHEFDARSPA